MKLVICEKPSVAKAVASALGVTSRADGCFEGNGYLVSWCVGHLVELAPPGYNTAIASESVQSSPQAIPPLEN